MITLRMLGGWASSLGGSATAGVRVGMTSERVGVWQNGLRTEDRWLRISRVVAISAQAQPGAIWSSGVRRRPASSGISWMVYPADLLVGEGRAWTDVAVTVRLVFFYSRERGEKIGKIDSSIWGKIRSGQGRRMGTGESAKTSFLVLISVEVRDQVEWQEKFR